MLWFLMCFRSYKRLEILTTAKAVRKNVYSNEGMTALRLDNAIEFKEYATSNWNLILVEMG